MSTRGFAVVDVETTGLFPGGSDRMIELTVVTTDEFGTVTGEWETVVNPRRHIGAGHVHGLDGATLMNAPAFADILSDLLDVLDGRAIVAHSAPGVLSPEPFAAWMPRATARATARDERHFLERMSAALPEVSAPEAHLNYLALLDRCLIDRHVSQHEAAELISLADELGVDRPTALALHESYLQQLAAVAWADGVLTAEERADIEAVARMLGVSDEVRERALDARGRERATPVAPAPAAGAAASAIAPGSIVVLTWAMSRPREQWEAELAAAGFRIASAVSKKVGLVVAADPDSLSGKARKAREYRIPVVGESFLHALLSSDGGKRG